MFIPESGGTENKEQGLIYPPGWSLWWMAEVWTDIALGRGYLS